MEHLETEDVLEKLQRSTSFLMVGTLEHEREMLKSWIPLSCFGNRGRMSTLSLLVNRVGW